MNGHLTSSNSAAPETRPVIVGSMLITKGRKHYGIILSKLLAVEAAIPGKRSHALSFCPIPSHKTSLTKAWSQRRQRERKRTKASAAGDDADKFDLIAFAKGACHLPDPERREQSTEQSEPEDRQTTRYIARSRAARQRMCCNGQTKADQCQRPDRIDRAVHSTKDSLDE